LEIIKDTSVKPTTVPTVRNEQGCNENKLPITSSNEKVNSSSILSKPASSGLGLSFGNLGNGGLLFQNGINNVSSEDKMKKESQSEGEKNFSFPKLIPKESQNEISKKFGLI
jgi:hypothetical protein